MRTSGPQKERREVGRGLEKRALGMLPGQGGARDESPGMRRNRPDEGWARKEVGKPGSGFAFVEQTSWFVQHGAEAKNRSAGVARWTEKEACAAVTIGYCYVANRPQTQ